MSICFVLYSIMNLVDLFRIYAAFSMFCCGLEPGYNIENEDRYFISTSGSEPVQTGPNK